MNFDKIELLRKLQAEKHDDLLEYYKILREMLKNFNNMILTITIRGATVVLSIIAITAYFPVNKSGYNAFISLFVTFASLVICYNLKLQNNFFTGMLKYTVKTAKKVEALIFSDKILEDDLPTEIMITHKIEEDFPGIVFVKKRENFFPIIFWFLVVYFFSLFFYTLFLYGNEIVIEICNWGLAKNINGCMISSFV